MNNLGQFFKNEREKLGVTIEDVADNLKMKTKYISDFEENINQDINKIYFYGFIKSYAQFLKINEEEIIGYAKNNLIDKKNLNKEYQLLNLDNEEIKNPNKDFLISSSLIFLVILIIFIFLSQFTEYNPKISELIIDKIQRIEK